MADGKLELESTVERHLRVKVESRGGMCPKFDPGSARGFPDRIAIFPGGVYVWVETKRPKGGKLSGPQRVAHELLRRMGCLVRVVSTKAQADALVREFAPKEGEEEEKLKSRCP